MKVGIPQRRSRIYMASSSPKLELLPYTGSNGLYSAVQPQESSKKFLLALAKQLGFDIDPAKLHVTVMYSKTGANGNVDCEPERMYRCKFKKLQYWDGHDNKGYISAALESPELEEEHNRLKALGCEPTFTPYEPHCTLWSGAKLTADLEDRMAKVTHNLKASPDLLFGSQHIGNLDD